MPTYRLIPNNPDVNFTTGQHTVEAMIEEHQDDGTVVQGVVEKYGMSAAEINRRFGGNVDQWLAWIGGDMLAKHKSRQGVHTELFSKRGIPIDITE